MSCTHLTLTSVVFEFPIKCFKYMVRCNLTLTSVVFELRVLWFVMVNLLYLTLTSVVFELSFGLMVVNHFRI